MKKGIIVLALVGILTGIVLASCNRDKTSNELELFSTKAENKDTLEKLIKEFNALQQNYTIKLTCVADAQTVLKTRLAKNDIPDILALGGDSTYTELQSAGVLMDLSDDTSVDKVQEAYLQMVYDVNKGKEQKAYGVPYATNASGIIYNVDKFETLHLEVPKTWDDFMKVIEKIEASGEQPFVLTYKDAWTSLCSWNSMAPDLQPDNFTEARERAETTFASTHQEVAEKYLTIISHGQKDFMGTTYDDGNKLFANGTGVMMINGNWVINQLKSSNPDCNIDMFAFPASNDVTKNYVTSGVDVLFAISENCKNPEIAKEFLAFMLKQRNAKTYIEEQFSFSAVKGVEQEDSSVAGLKEEIARGKVANFPDHYYPSAFDLASLLSEFSLNYVNGMDNKENIATFLKNCDDKYDIANVE